MKEQVFCYHGLANGWQELNGSANDFAEDLPPIFLVSYHDEGTGEHWERIWCEEHRAYETLKEQTGTEVVTETGCRMTGFCTKLPIFIVLSGWNVLQQNREEVDVCFRILPGTEKGTYRCHRIRARLSFTWQQGENGRAYLCPHLVGRNVQESKISPHTSDRQCHLPKEILSALEGDFSQIQPNDTKAGQPLMDREDFLRRNEEMLRRADFDYNDGDYALECSINGYNFRLIASWKQFDNIVCSIDGLSVVIPDEVKKSATALVAVERKGRYLAAIALDGKREHHLYRAYDRNILLEVKLTAVHDLWAKRNNVDYHRMCSPFELPENRFQVSKLLQHEPERFSLRQLLQIPENEVFDGYYLLLRRKLAEAGLPRVPVPKEGDDQSYLLKKIPLAARIIDAAFQENAEAAYALSTMYSDRSCFYWPSRRFSQCWYERAVLHGWGNLSQESNDLILS